MYKVFFNEYCLLISDRKDNSFKNNILENVNIESIDDFFKLLLRLERHEFTVAKINLSFLNLSWETFYRNSLEKIDAAGGMVHNSRGELLCIKRWGIWDLPKGKIEAGEQADEAAIREVNEECGILEHHISGVCPDTWHLYRSPYILKENNWVLKHTYWFKMVDNKEEFLIPQISEDIDDVKWCSSEFVKNEVLNNTYSSLKPLFNLYLLG